MISQLLTATAIPFQENGADLADIKTSTLVTQSPLEPKIFPHRKWPVHTSRAEPAADWSLRIFGAVGDELRFRRRDLVDLPEAATVFDAGVSTFTRGERRWRGIDAWTVLALAGIRGDAEWLTVHSEGGYSRSLELDRFFAGPSVLAQSVDGRPLSNRDGGPLRLILPGIAPWMSARWVRGLELTVERPE